jgi:uncharacterized protein YukE
MPARKATAIVQLKVRMREELRRRLEREAAQHEDSINNEVVRRLKDSFKRDADQGLAAEVQKLQRQNTNLNELLDELTPQLRAVHTSLRGVLTRVNDKAEEAGPKRRKLEAALSEALSSVDETTATEIRTLAGELFGMFSVAQRMKRNE